MAVAGFYKRVLPCPPAIEFASTEGKELFKEALEDGTLTGFFRLIGTFQTQAEPAFCGLTTLSVVLNALSIDPGRKWKGPWRWYDETMLDCCEPLEKVKLQGISFAKVTCLAECAGASVQAFRANETSLESFRQAVEDCTSSEDRHLVVSYDRRKLKQTGTGHFSPLGGYHRQKDMALILDVARFKYPPHWVPLSVLWDAMHTVDESTGKLRGFMLISKREDVPASLFTLSCKDDRWRAMMKHLLIDVPKLLKAAECTDELQVIQTAFGSLPADATSFIKWIAEVKLVEEAERNIDKNESERLQHKVEVLLELRQTRVFALVCKWMESQTNAETSLSGSLHDAVAKACCQGAAVVGGLPCSDTIVNGFKCCMREGNDCQAAVMSTKVLVNGCEQTIDVLVPTTSAEDTVKELRTCLRKETNFHPTARDVLSILLLGLPITTWETIADEKLKAVICKLVSKEELPKTLQSEVMHVSNQLMLVSKTYIEEYEL